MYYLGSVIGGRTLLQVSELFHRYLGTSYLVFIIFIPFGAILDSKLSL